MSLVDRPDAIGEIPLTMPDVPEGRGSPESRISENGCDRNCSQPNTENVRRRCESNGRI
jgi:hypothetical protein